MLHRSSSIRRDGRNSTHDTWEGCSQAAISLRGISRLPLACNGRSASWMSLLQRLCLAGRSVSRCLHSCRSILPMRGICRAFSSVKHGMCIWAPRTWWKCSWAANCNRESEGCVLSHSEIIIDVWKYIRTIIIGLYAICGHLLHNPNRTHSRVSACLCLCLCVRLRLCLCPFICVCVSVSVTVSVCLCLSLCLFLCVCVFVCVRVRVWLCVPACVCTCVGTCLSVFLEEKEKRQREKERTYELHGMMWGYMTTIWAYVECLMRCMQSYPDDTVLYTVHPICLWAVWLHSRR